MERDHTAANGDRLMKSGDIAESDDGARIASNGLVVDAVENSHRAISTSREEEGVEFIRVEKLVELLEALVVGAGEIAAMTIGEVGGERDTQAFCFQIFFWPFRSDRARRETRSRARQCGHFSRAPEEE